MQLASGLSSRARWGVAAIRQDRKIQKNDTKTNKSDAPELLYNFESDALKPKWVLFFCVLRHPIVHYLLHFV
jgi:hypothetical protein